MEEVHSLCKVSRREEEERGRRRIEEEEDGLATRAVMGAMTDRCWHCVSLFDTSLTYLHAFGMREEG